MGLRDRHGTCLVEIFRAVLGPSGMFKINLLSKRIPDWVRLKAQKSPINLPKLPSNLPKGSKIVTALGGPTGMRLQAISPTGEVLGEIPWPPFSRRVRPHPAHEGWFLVEYIDESEDYSPLPRSSP